MKHTLIYRVLNENDNCREYYFNCIGDTLKGFKEYYKENYNYLDSKSIEYLKKHYGHYLSKNELNKL